jgi:TRAP-type C4-dicarboxylate transport system substrate-binding protein
MKRVPLTLAVLAALGVSGLTLAQSPSIELKFASSAPPTSPWAKQIDRTAAQVGEATKGAVKITPFFGSQLGSENDAIAQISRGRIEMGSFTANAVALQVPELALLQLPFFFDGQPQRDCVLDQHVQNHTVEALAKKNLVFISWGEVGSIHLPGKKAYLTPVDVKGIKVGVVANKMTADFWRAMGANPIPTSVAEATSSSQTGLIDTYPTPFAFYVPSGLNKVLPVMSKLPLWESAGLTLMNKAAFDKLPADLRTSFEVGLRMTPVSTLRAEIRGVDTALTNVHVKSGGTVVQATPEQRAEWSKGLEPIWAAIAKDIGPDGEKFFGLMSAGKKACAGAK